VISTLGGSGVLTEMTGVAEAVAEADGLAVRVFAKTKSGLKRLKLISPKVLRANRTIDTNVFRMG
jgi:hypothetical protein